MHCLGHSVEQGFCCLGRCARIPRSGGRYRYAFVNVTQARRARHPREHGGAWRRGRAPGGARRGSAPRCANNYASIFQDGIHNCAWKPQVRLAKGSSGILQDLRAAMPRWWHNRNHRGRGHWRSCRARRHWVVIGVFHLGPGDDSSDPGLCVTSWTEVYILRCHRRCGPAEGNPSSHLALFHGCGRTRHRPLANSHGRRISRSQHWLRIDPFEIGRCYRNRCNVHILWRVSTQRAVVSFLRRTFSRV